MESSEMLRRVYGCGKGRERRGERVRWWCWCIMLGVVGLLLAWGVDILSWLDMVQMEDEVVATWRARTQSTLGRVPVLGQLFAPSPPHPYHVCGPRPR